MAINSGESAGIEQYDVVVGRSINIFDESDVAMHVGEIAAIGMPEPGASGLEWLVGPSLDERLVDACDDVLIPEENGSVTIRGIDGTHWFIFKAMKVGVAELELHLYGNDNQIAMTIRRGIVVNDTQTLLNLPPILSE